MKKEKQQLAVEWLETRAEEREKNNSNESAYWHLREFQKDLEQAKEMEKEQRQKKENQFVLNMPFDIQPLTKEVEMSSPSHKQELVIGYVIKDAKGVEYYFYEEDGVLKYDGWSADLPTTKTEE
jgi:hypothetical protein